MKRARRLRAERLQNDVFQRVRFGFFGRNLVGVDELLHERLIFRDLINLAAANEIGAAVADLDQIDRFLRHADAGKRRAHPVKLRVGAALLVNAVIGMKRGVVKSSDQ